MSQGNLVDGHRRPLWLDIAMRRCLHRGDQGFTGEIALETAEFLGEITTTSSRP
jgi:hypothetical protein